MRKFSRMSIAIVLFQPQVSRADGAADRPRSALKVLARFHTYAGQTNNFAG